MTFSGIEFLLYFLPIFLILYMLTPAKYRNAVLLLGSLVFYTLGEVWYLPVLLLSMAVNYFIGLHLRPRNRSDKKGKKNRGKKNKEKKNKEKKACRKWLLALAILGNVGVLVMFKSGFVWSGLPLGMSFYTFQILSYLIDVSRGTIKAERSWIKFFAYVAMFPRLVSGPIVRYGEMASELTKRKMTLDGVQDGLKLFTIGLASKVLLADRVGILWHEVQVAGFGGISTPLAWLAAIAYSFKIYFDFCGYSLMAVGLGRMLGFALPDNFKNPYMALSVRDFYRRWHITLGNWFRDYVYIPLGGSRKGEPRTILNLLAVWLLTAVWHGFTVNFLLWGLVLWAFIVLERLLGKLVGKIFARKNSDGEVSGGKASDGKVLGGKRHRKLHILSHLYLWAVIPVTWMCFAITNLQQLETYLGRMFCVVPQVAGNGEDWLMALRDYGGLLLVSIAACLPFLQKCYRKWKNSFLVKILLAVLFWICVWRISIEGNNPFMYLMF